MSLSHSDSHCKLCAVRNECDVSGCPNAHLAERREPSTAVEAQLAERLRYAVRHYEVDLRALADD